VVHDVDVLGAAAGQNGDGRHKKARQALLYPFHVIVAHLDLDAFFATVEELENPDLRSVPLIVGGDPHGRGVVATANYVARRFGIHSAMSAAEALRRCPKAVFVRPRHSLYRDYSREVWSAIREIVPTVEQAGIDEGYLDLGEISPTFDDARALAEAVRAVVRARTRLSCSLGVATSKVVAKVASDRRKPGGLTVVRPGREAAFLAPFPIRILPGVGPRAEERLKGFGIVTIGELAAITDEQLGGVMRGKVGRELRDRARGIDPRPLEMSTERISISQEETFARDVSDPEALHDELRRMSVKLSEHLRGRGQVARTVTTKVRYPDFSIRTRSTSLPVGTDDAGRIGELACALLDRALRDRPAPLRLVGVGVSGLQEHVQLSLPAVV
jgi:DNA polymerase-4